MFKNSILLYSIILFNLIITTLIFSQQHYQHSSRGVYQPKHSFSGPFYFSLQQNIPFWDYGGSSVATDNYVRLVPAIQSRSGWIWNTEKVFMEEWEAILEFNVHNDQSLGADGLAFWYSKTPKIEGSLFGNQEDFDGYGIVFDTYDNNQNGDTPAVVLIKNNGNKNVKWDYDNDLVSNQIERCRADFRNIAKGSTVFVKIIYQRKTLQVLIDTSGGHGDFHYCWSSDNIELPKGYYFGITAHTGGLADNHDVHSFKVYDLNPKKTIEHEKEHANAQNRGWFDPYSLVNKNKEENQKKRENQNKNNQYNNEKLTRDRIRKLQKDIKNNNSDDDDDEKPDFFENLKKKLKKYGIDPKDTTDKPQKDNNQNDQQQASTQSFNQQNQQQQQQQQQQKQFEPASKKQANLNQDFSGGNILKLKIILKKLVKKETSIILEALEAITKRNDKHWNVLNEKIEDIKNKQSVLLNSFSTFQDSITREIDQGISSNLKKETNHLHQEINRLHTFLGELSNELRGISNTQTDFSSRLLRTKEDLTKSVRSSSSWGFWTYMFLIIIICIALFFIWRNLKEISNRDRGMKLY